MAEILVINPSDKKEYTIEAHKNGENLMLCPVCSHERKKKTLKCFSYNLQKNAGRCNHCGVVLVQKSDKPEFIKTVYKKPIWTNKTNISNKALQWFENRKITQGIINELKVSEGVCFMPQIAKETNTIQFNYFKLGELVNIKYRDGAKHFKLFKDGELIFYNLDAAINSKEIIIVEGEMDVLALYQSGFKNCISVPNGCNEKGNINMDYLDNCIDFFDEDCKFILALDNDKVGIRLRDELARRLGYENCSIVTFKDCKDANDCLIKYGIIGVTESLEAKKDYPIQGVFSPLDFQDEIWDYYNNGLPKGYGIGMSEFDMFLRFQPGYLTTITGIPGHGKSEFLDFIICRLNISHDWKFALYSPENHPLQLHFSKLAEKIIGKSFEGKDRMSPIDLTSTIDYLKDSFFFVNPEDDFSLDSILLAVKSLVRKKGIKAFVIDAWNKLDHKYTTNETQYISQQLDKITLFCEKNNVHCFLVAHPTKIQKDANTGKYLIPNLYNISGSANFYNKTANGITVYRDYDKFTTEVYIQKVKFKNWGEVGTVTLAWDKINGRYYKGYPSYDSWITKPEPAQLENNESFLDIITNNGKYEDEPF
jgi:twinkle protein